MENKAEKAFKDLSEIDKLSSGPSFIHRLPPVFKLAVTIIYIIIVISFNKYDLPGLFIMILYPIIAYQISGIPLKTCFIKLKLVIPLVCAVGIFNPIFDREILFTLGNVPVSAGVISMLTLMLKGIFTLMASFLLISTTKIEEICLALRQLHIPKILTSLLLLTFRYISLLLDEVSIMTTAYALRAPGQKGIHYKAWGSFLGQLLLRTMDRATLLYEGMELRGFQGEFFYARKEYSMIQGIIYASICIGIFLLFRFFPVLTLVGRLFT